MSRLIDADALKAEHGMKDDCADCDRELRGKSRSCEFDRIYTLMDFCGWLDDAPTIEPNRKKGKWSFIGYQMFECTECGTFYTQSQFQQMRVMITDPDFPRFCPTCGADMRDGGETGADD